MLDEGHLIGSHGHSHRKLTSLSYEEQFSEIKRSKEILESVTGTTVHWFRPAFGLYDENTMKAVKQLNIKMVLWQIASWDWMHKKDEEKIVDNVVEHVSQGDLILLHELPQTLKILPNLIQGIREKGLDLAQPYTKLNLKKSWVDADGVV